MSKPTGKLAFAYRTIAILEAKVETLEAALTNQPAAGEPVAWADNIALGRIASGRSVVTLSNVETVDYSIPLFRVAPVAADDPAAWMIDWPDEPELGHYFSESPDKQPGVRSRPLWSAPPAAAHGDEAVRKDAERYRWLRANDAHPSDWNDEAIDAAMRAQGDGEVH